MAKLHLALDTLRNALLTLEEIVSESKDDRVWRDASIQRFECTFEAFWKTVKAYLYEYEGIECNSPKGCLRNLSQTGLASVDETERLLLMCDDRNLVSHTYIQAIADTIYKRLSQHVFLLRNLLTRIEMKCS